ncbi:hypothetical protein WA158_007484 [Blastocystis sp. Blastoise]
MIEVFENQWVTQINNIKKTGFNIGIIDLKSMLLYKNFHVYQPKNLFSEFKGISEIEPIFIRKNNTKHEYTFCDGCLLARIPVDYTQLPFAGDHNEKMKYVEFPPKLFPSCVLTTKLPKYTFGKEDIYIVTGSSSNHFQPNINLIYSIIEQRLDIPIIFIDFGLTIDEVHHLMNIFLFIDTIRKSYNINLPSFYRKVDWKSMNNWMKKGQRVEIMAAKAIIQVDILEETEGKGWWLDSGDEIIESFFKKTVYLNKYGFVSLRSGGSIKQYTHNKTIEWFHFNDTEYIYRQPPCSSGVTGLNWNNTIIRNYIAPLWRECSFDINCHSPEGSNFYNHRQDQASLTWLIHHYRIQNACIYTYTPWIRIHIDHNRSLCNQRALEQRINYIKTKYYY